MKIPKSFGEPLVLNAFIKIEAKEDTRPSKWWTELSDDSKAEYVAEHPGSKYADFHRQEQEEKTKPPSPPTETHVKPKANPPHNGARPSGIRDHSGQEKKPKDLDQMGKSGSHEPKHEKPHFNKNATPEDRKREEVQKIPAKPGLKEYSHPDMKPGGEKRKAIVSFLKKKTSHIISHVKHEGKEWKTAGLALKKLATGNGITHEDKKALGSVAADLAAVTASLAVGGGAAHGIAAFLHHFGSHLAQEMLIKAAVKGAAGAAHHASIMTLSSEEDEVLERALKMMMEVLENGDLEALAKEFEAKAAKEGKGNEAKKDLGASVSPQNIMAGTEVQAGLDMSAEVAGSGFCPECRSKMTIAQVGGSPSWVCRADRISLPLPDDHDYYKKGPSLVG